MPAPLAPMLCSPARTLPTGSGWAMEPKWDGYRVLLSTGPQPRAWSRAGRRLSISTALEDELTALPGGAVIDAELVCLVDRDGQIVQHRGGLARWTTGGSGEGQLHVVAFDLPVAGGERITAQPQHARRAALADMIGPTTLSLVDSGPVDPAMHAFLVAAGFEGTVCKQTASRYVPGRRSRSWQKLRGPIVPRGPASTLRG